MPKKTPPPKKPIKRDTCGAIKPRSKQPCGLPAGYGTDHPGQGPCKHHFGCTPYQTGLAARDDGRDVIEVLRGMGVEMDIDPLDALVWAVRDVAGRVAWHAAVIAKWQVLNPDGTARALTTDEESFYKRYQEERDSLVKAARMAQSAGVAERAVTLAEQQASIMGNAIDEILARLQLTDAQRDLVPEVVPEVIRAMAVRVPLIEGVHSTDEALNAALVQAREARGLTP